jgi:hypothetical protein
VKHTTIIEPRQRPNTRMQHDRFAREIIAILAPSGAARPRRLMGTPLGHHLFSAYLY